MNGVRELFRIEDETMLKAATTAGFDVRSTMVDDQQYQFKTIQAKDWHQINLIELLRQEGHGHLLERYQRFVADPSCGILFKDMVKELFYALARRVFGLPPNAPLQHRYQQPHLSNHYMGCNSTATCKRFRCRWCEQNGVAVDNLELAQQLHLDEFKNYGRCDRCEMLPTALTRARLGASTLTGIAIHEKSF